MIYDYPRYYELALSFRDIKVEAEFLHRCINSFSTVPVESVFEIACGPAPHAGDLVRLGYEYIGLDINRKMLDYARRQWRGLSPAPSLIEGDMAHFEVPHMADFAFVLLGSLYLDTFDEMSRHFDCMARVLRPGGIYFLDWCVQYGDPLAHSNDNAYLIERDGIVIESAFDIKLINQEENLYEEVWTLGVNDNGQLHRFEMIERNKAVFPDEFERFIGNRSDFEIIGRFADWDLERTIKPGAEVSRPVILLRRS